MIDPIDQQTAEAHCFKLHDIAQTDLRLDVPPGTQATYSQPWHDLRGYTVTCPTCGTDHPLFLSNWSYGIYKTCCSHSFSLESTDQENDR